MEIIRNKYPKYLDLVYKYIKFEGGISYKRRIRLPESNISKNFYSIRFDYNLKAKSCMAIIFKRDPHVSHEYNVNIYINTNVWEHNVIRF